MKLYHKPNGDWNIWKIVRHLLFVIVIIGAAYLGNIYRQVDRSVETMHREVTIAPKREIKAEVTTGDPINVLLLGTDADELERDESEGYVARTDTMIVMTLNPELETTQLVSIPRDTIVEIKGIDYPDKINHAYAFGEEELAIDAVQEFLQIPIDYYMTVNMSGLEELIDAIGGVEVTSPLTFDYRGTNFKKGETRHLDGVKAMNFARMRYDDPEGEIGRQNRQKMVIKAMVKQALSLDLAKNLPQLLEVASRYVKTNFDLTRAMELYKLYRPALNQMTTLTFDEIEEMYIGNGFYFYVPQKERRRISNAIRRLSGMPSVRLADLKDPFGDEDDELTDRNIEAIERGQERNVEVQDPVPVPPQRIPPARRPAAQPETPTYNTGGQNSSTPSTQYEFQSESTGNSWGDLPDNIITDDEPTSQETNDYESSEAGDAGNDYTSSQEAPASESTPSDDGGMD